MKRFLALLLCLLTAALAGCAAAQPQKNEKLLVYTSFYPMYDFAKKIGGEHAEVVCMVPDGTEPHDWEPVAADIAGLSHASLFIYHGLGMEHWAEDVLRAVDNPDLTVVAVSDGIAARQETAAGEGGLDPHAWLDPMNAKKELLAIKNAFAEKDPANAADYEANYTKYAAEMDALDSEFRSALSGLPNKDVIVSHAAYGYLCAAYGLNQIPIEGLAADSEPDPATMAAIIDFAKQRNVRTVFFEELVSPAVAETIARAVGAKTAVLSPVEGLSDAERAAGADYVSVMRANLAALVDALK